MAIDGKGLYEILTNPGCTQQDYRRILRISRYKEKVIEYMRTLDNQTRLSRYQQITSRDGSFLSRLFWHQRLFLPCSLKRGTLKIILADKAKIEAGIQAVKNMHEDPANRNLKLASQIDEAVNLIINTPDKRSNIILRTFKEICSNGYGHDVIFNWLNDISNQTKENFGMILARCPDKRIIARYLFLLKNMLETGADPKLMLAHLTMQTTHQWSLGTFIVKYADEASMQAYLDILDTVGVDAAAKQRIGELLSLPTIAPKMPPWNPARMQLWGQHGMLPYAPLVVMEDRKPNENEILFHMAAIGSHATLAELIKKQYPDLLPRLAPYVDLEKITDLNATEQPIIGLRGAPVKSGDEIPKGPIDAATHEIRDAVNTAMVVVREHADDFLDGVRGRINTLADRFIRRMKQF